MSLQVVFWTMVGLVIYAYLGYPAALIWLIWRLVARPKARRTAPLLHPEVNP